MREVFNRRDDGSDGPMLKHGAAMLGRIKVM